MQVKELLKALPQAIFKGDAALEVRGLSYDSRHITPGSVFFCIKGYKFDGHNFAAEAINRGASVIVAQENLEVPPGVTVITVPDTRKAMALMAAAFYRHPARDFKLCGITGTNGKTTITYMLDRIFSDAGYLTGVIGTLQVLINGKPYKTEHTTPESLDLQQLFAGMRDAGVKYVNMEVSSHSLELNRVYGCPFNAAVFTNLTQDHLDFHKDMPGYFASKLKLFALLQPGGYGIINKDDAWGARILALHPGFTSYALEQPADYTAADLSCSSQGSSFDLVTPQGNAKVNLKLQGKFNVSNALAAAAVAMQQGIPLDKVCRSLEAFTGVKGRFESISAGQKFLVLVDYAHTPDALQKVLATAREITPHKLICVFGCGGDRDPKKRPLMGTAALAASDLVIVTSDNPRTEDPGKIIEDIEQGLKPQGRPYRVEPDRRAAIFAALSEAREGDTVVIAGKGHEDYQILNTGTIHFDDAEVVREFFSSHPETS